MKLRSTLLAAIAVLVTATAAHAAPFPDPQANAPVKLAAAKVVGEYPVGTFLENLVVEGNDIIATDLASNALYRINKTTGARRTIAQLPSPAAGIAPYNGGYVVTGASGDGQPAVLGVTRAGVVTKIVDLPRGGFLNGISPFDRNRFLVADSGAGAIYLVDVAKKSATVWFQDPILTSDGVFKPFIPGVNGVRRRGSYVYASSMQQQLLLRFPVNPDGTAGKFETIARNVALDDFAVTRDGTVYATTHIFDSVLKITPNGAITTVATHDQGLLGPTSTYFGTERGGEAVLYVTNNGQMYIPPAEGPGTARIVRIQLDR